MQKRRELRDDNGISPVPLINLIRTCLNDDNLTQNAQVGEVVHVLDGWIGVGALLFSQHFLNHRDDKLRAAINAILQRRMDHFAYETFVLSVGTSGLAKEEARDVGDDRVIVNPVPYSQRTFWVSIRKPRGIGTDFDEIAHLFQRCTLPPATDSPIGRHVFLPTSPIFFVNRIDKLVGVPSIERSEILMQMLLYWCMIASSADIAAAYLYSSEEWFNVITSNHQDKMLGDGKFHLVCAWWSLREKLLQGKWRDEAVEKWLEFNAEASRKDRNRAACFSKFDEMMTSLTGVFDEVQKKLARALDHH